MALTERTQRVTVASALEQRAATDPENVFLVFDEDRLSFGQVERQARALAASLRNLGIEQGDRVALVLPCWPEFVISMFAAAKLGVVLVPLNPRLTTPELQYMLRHSEAVGAVTVESYNELDYLHLFEDLLIELPELRYVVTVGDEDLWHDDRIFQFEDLISAGEGREHDESDSVTDDDVFAILYTSGTTGKPKGVELTHGNLVRTALQTIEALGVTGDDRIIGVNALFHVFGLGPGILGTVQAGASIVMQDEFDGGETLDLIEQHGVTVHYGVPTHFVTELHEQKRSPRDVSRPPYRYRCRRAHRRRDAPSGQGRAVPRPASRLFVDRDRLHLVHHATGRPDGEAALHGGTPARGDIGTSARERRG